MAMDKETLLHRLSDLRRGLDDTEVDGMRLLLDIEDNDTFTDEQKKAASQLIAEFGGASAQLQDLYNDILTDK